MFATLVILVGCGIALLQCAVLWRLVRLLRLFHKRQLLTAPSMVSDLPSVSVCIPARNEQHAMTRCLEAVLQSRYKKLEVLVLDDESVDNTSSLIRAFAKDGVRFIEGGAPPSDWLGKNYALDRLAHEASGTYVLFLDVDTILSPYSISQLVAYAETSKANMVSVLPTRSDLWRMSVVMAPLRYFWSIVFHGVRRPVAAGNIWMVRRVQFLEDYANLEGVKAEIEPEVAIARQYLATASYRFLTSRQLLGITYEKKYSSQVETIARLRFPRLGYSVVRTLSAALLALIVAVYVGVLVAVGGDAMFLAVVLYVLGALCYYMYLRFTWMQGAWLGMWLWPLVLLQDAGLTLMSLVSYATGRVTWKGRPIATTRRLRL